MKKLKNFFNLNALLLTIYISLVLIIDIFLNTHNFNNYIFFIFLGIIIIYIISFYICKNLTKIKLTCKKPSKKIENFIYFFIFFTISLSILLLWYIAYYPGCFSQDSKEQYEQATNISPYNDWHPVLHTILFFKVPLVISGRTFLFYHSISNYSIFINTRIYRNDYTEAYWRKTSFNFTRIYHFKSIYRTHNTFSMERCSFWNF